MNIAAPPTGTRRWLRTKPGLWLALACARLAFCGVAVPAQSPNTNLSSAFPVWKASAGQTNAQFSISAACAGDVNGDGFADIIVGAPRFTGTLIEEGAAFVYYGSKSGLPAKPSWREYGAHRYADFGFSVAPAGDVNNDGFDDVIVGAFGESHGEGREGAVYVFYGSSRGLSGPNWFVECNKSGAALGHGVGAAGDVNGDGFVDIIVGAPTYKRRYGRDGRAFVFHGSAVGLETKPAWTASVDHYRASFGRTVASAGDVNGDGFADIIVGALMDRFDPEGGQVTVYAGSRSGVLPADASGELGGISARRLAPPAPPVWKQGWFFAAMGLALVAAAAALWHVITTTHLRRQLRRAGQQRALEQERLRIAQDLHDQLGSNLTTIALLSEVARRDLDAPQKADAHIQNISSTARDLTRALEEIVWAVNPRKDKLDQVVAYLSAQAEEFLKPTDLRCRLDFPDELPQFLVPSEVRHELFLVFKEALTNVVKHAAASEVRISLGVADSRLRLTIEDNGHGFDTAASACNGNGLANMRARIEKLGGVCEVSSQSGRGTHVGVEIKLTATVSAG